MDTDLQTFLDLVQVPGEPGSEAAVIERIRGMLLAMGVPVACMAQDETQAQSEYGGEAGNLIVRLDGTGRGERRMLSTHVDTVPIAVGSKPRVEGDRVVNDAADHALGADARAGCAILLAAVRALMDRRDNHPPRTFVFFVQEEVGLVGSRGLDVALLGDPTPAMCFNYDGSETPEIVTAIIGTERFEIEITGVPAHGGRPQQGISTITIAANALAELDREEWNGRIERGDVWGTANLGLVRGGQGSNVVMPDFYGLAESRSHDLAFRRRIVETWQAAFETAVAAANDRAIEADGRASVAFKPGPAYDPYRLPEDAPVVRAAVAALERCGVAPRLVRNDGGMDCNHIVAKGIPAVGMGTGHRGAHSVDEHLDIPDFVAACRAAVVLATGEAS